MICRVSRRCRQQRYKVIGQAVLVTTCKDLNLVCFLLGVVIVQPTFARIAARGWQACTVGRLVQSAATTRAAPIWQRAAILSVCRCLSGQVAVAELSRRPTLTHGSAGLVGAARRRGAFR